MTGRIPLDDMTSDQLDQLYDQLAALRQVARGYCPHCGRGDAAPTVADWEQQKQRADFYEAAHARMRDRLEVTVVRVRRAAELIRNGAPWTANLDSLADRIEATLEDPVGPAATEATQEPT